MVPTQQFQGPGFNNKLQLLSLWIFLCSPRVCVSFHQVHWFPPTSKKHTGT